MGDGLVVGESGCGSECAAGWSSGNGLKIEHFVSGSWKIRADLKRLAILLMDLVRLCVNYFAGKPLLCSVYRDKDDWDCRLLGSLMNFNINENTINQSGYLCGWCGRWCKPETRHKNPSSEMGRHIHFKFAYRVDFPALRFFGAAPTSTPSE